MPKRKETETPREAEAARKKRTEEAYFTLEVPPGSQGGRPRKVLNELGKETVEKLAALQCPIEEIAAFMCCSTEALNNPQNRVVFKELYKRGKENGKRTIRTALYKSIKDGNNASIIFACKSILGMSDNVETNSEASILTGFVKTIDELAEEDDERPENEPAGAQEGE